MSDTTTIFRPQSEAEKTDFIALGKKGIEHQFRASLIAEEQKFVKAHKPFCYRCAKLDFQDKVEVLKKELERKGIKREITLDEVNISLAPYGDIKRFSLLDKKEVNEDKLLDGIRTSVMTGINEIYQCNERRCGITVFVPLPRELKGKTVNG